GAGLRLEGGEPALVLAVACESGGAHWLVSFVGRRGSLVAAGLRIAPPPAAFCNPPPRKFPST
ncbi:MAG: hypothetical protein ACREMB_06030, partial [Candidatus Rokuibacteriota bacterium]